MSTVTEDRVNHAFIKSKADHKAKRETAKMAGTQDIGDLLEESDNEQEPVVDITSVKKSVTKDKQIDNRPVITPFYLPKVDKPVKGPERKNIVVAGVTDSRIERSPKQVKSKPIKVEPDQPIKVEPDQPIKVEPDQEKPDEKEEVSTETDEALVPTEKNGSRKWWWRRDDKQMGDGTVKPGMPEYLKNNAEITILAESYIFHDPETGKRNNKPLYRYTCFQTSKILEAAKYALHGQTKIKHGRHFFGVIQAHNSTRLYFDYDDKNDSYKKDDDDFGDLETARKDEVVGVLLNSIKVCTGATLTEKDLFIFYCSRDGKISFHIESRNHCMDSAKAVGVIAAHARKTLTKEVDDVVYKSVQNWRLSGSRKVGTNNTKELDDESTPLNRIFPQQIEGCEKIYLLEEFRNVYNQKTTKSTDDVGDLPDQVVEALKKLMPNAVIDGIRVEQPEGEICPQHDRSHNDNGRITRFKDSYFYRCYRSEEGTERSIFLWKSGPVKISRFPREPYVFADYLRDVCGNTFDSIPDAEKFCVGHAIKCMAFFTNYNRTVLMREQYDGGYKVAGSGGLIKNYKDKVVYVNTEQTDAKGNTKTVQKPHNVIELIRNNEDLSYTQIEVLPCHDNEVIENIPEHSKGAFNVFVGFKAKLLKDSEITDVGRAGVKLLEDHMLKVWANNNEEYNKWIMAWHADVIQNLRNKQGISLTLISKPGAGKGLINDFDSQYVFGDDLAVTANGVDQIMEKFNSDMENVISVTVDEMSTLKGDYHSTADKMKNIVTDKKIRIETKGVDPRRIANYQRFRHFTNNHFAQKIEKHDRRIAVFECGDLYVKKDGDDESVEKSTEYFDKMYSKKVMSQEVGDAWFTHLYNLDISGINIRKIPMTAAKQRMIDSGMPREEMFYKDLINMRIEIGIETPEPGSSVLLKGVDLYKLYLAWAQEKSGKIPLTECKFKLAFTAATSIESSTYRVAIDASTHRVIEKDKIKKSDAKISRRGYMIVMNLVDNDEDVVEDEDKEN